MSKIEDLRQQAELPHWMRPLADQLSTELRQELQQLHQRLDLIENRQERIEEVLLILAQRTEPQDQ